VAAFFNSHADYELGCLGAEEPRKWFDIEGSRLLGELQDAVDNQYELRLRVWFQRSS
jgi:hypothetical protein